ncbi:MAG: proline iminopeptidase-family hydrolase [Thermomicrobiales bacterium]|nr:proline iminopeptidase-family hydrolase [Thermomicrobiales bacterium]
MSDRVVVSKEGKIPFRGYGTWYRIYGESEEPGKLPLLCLHGGPGAAHDYLESLVAMVGTGRRVIFYDQLGCSRSSIPESRPEMWTVDLYLDEVTAVRAALGLDVVHVLGQSWGGMLGMEYALTQPAGLASLIVASSPASMSQWVQEADRLRADLPPGVQAALRKHEDAGTFDDPEYVAAMQVFYDRHVCRVVPNPACVTRSFASISVNPEVYHTMNGPNEFHVIGTLRDWDITGRLGEIRVPTLVTSGRFDEATPAIAGTVHEGIPGSRWEIFEASSHMPHAEEPERYMAVLDGFLSEVEQAHGG